MSALLQETRIGSQVPRLHSCPPYFSSLGQDKIDLAAYAGLELDPWQQYVIEETSGRNRFGKYAAFEVGLIVPRQNGKGGIIEADQLASIFLTKDPQIIYSAHQFKTAKMMYRRIRDLCLNTPDLHKLVKAYRNSNEETGIETAHSRLNFFARSEGSGRGFSGKKMYFDEAYHLSAELIGDMLPTLSAMDSPQVWYASSAGMAASEQLARIRSRGIRGDGRLAFFEWSAPDDADPDSDEALYLSNPALGIRLDYEFIREVERASMDDETYARERLGIWAPPGNQAVISSAQWAAVLNLESRVADQTRLVFAIDAEVDRSSAAIGVAGVNAAGKIHLELVDQQPGVPWAAERMILMCEKRKPLAVLIDAGGPASSLIPALQQAKVPLRVTGTEDMKRACGAFVDAVAEQTIAHTGIEPRLDRAVLAGAKRPIGDGFGWRRKDAVTEIAPLGAVTLALYGLSVQKPKRSTISGNRKAVVL